MEVRVLLYVIYEGQRGGKCRGSSGFDAIVQHLNLGIGIQLKSVGTSEEMRSGHHVLWRVDLKNSFHSWI